MHVYVFIWLVQIRFCDNKETVLQLPGGMLDELRLLSWHRWRIENLSGVQLARSSCDLPEETMYIVDQMIDRKYQVSVSIT